MSFGIPSWGELIKNISKLYVEEELIPSISRHIDLGNY